MHRLEFDHSDPFFTAFLSHSYGSQETRTLFLLERLFRVRGWDAMRLPMRQKLFSLEPNLATPLFDNASIPKVRQDY